MDKMSRMKSSIRNIMFTILGSVVTMLLQLVNRRVFINYLASDYLGLNGLFSDILSMLSLSEMGIGTAMIYALYKPVAEKDNGKIKSLMQLYKRLYISIGCFVLIVGVALTPFLHIFIKEMPEIPYIHLYYVMFVVDSGMSYFYTYKRSLIICNQENYISSTTTMLSNICVRIVQLIFLIATHNYFLFLLTQIIFTRLENIVISKIADKKYPFLLEKDIEPLKKEDTESIKKNIFAMMAHKMGNVIVNGTDNLIVSKIMGLSVLGLYSNYALLINAISGLISKIFSAVTASIGNLVVEKNKEETEKVFYKILFMNYWIFDVCAICFYCLLQPFVKLWVGERFLLSNITVYVIVLLFYLNGMRRTVLEFRNATGIFWYDRYKAIIEAITNLVVSIPLTYIWGVMGVKMGSVIALLSTSFWVEGWVLYRHFFQKTSMQYLRKQIFYGLLTLLQCVLLNCFCRIIDDGSILTFLIQCIFCFMISNLVIIILFWHTEEFRYYLNIAKQMLTKRRNSHD